MTQEIFYTVELDGDDLEYDCETRDQAVEKANEHYCEQQEEEGGWRNGQTTSTEAEVVCYSRDEDGECTEVSREKVTLEFEYYHGDLAEHGTYY